MKARDIEEWERQRQQIQEGLEKSKEALRQQQRTAAGLERDIQAEKKHFLELNEALIEKEKQLPLREDLEEALGYAVKGKTYPAVKNQYLKELAESRIAQEIGKLLDNKQKEAAPADKGQNLPQTAKEEKKEAYRMYCFTSIGDVMSYCRAIGLKQPIRSHLYKEKENYYLIVDRYRISEFHFNLLTAVAFDYARVLVDSDHLYDHLREHGELLIGDRAIGTLRKI